jgi:hypothetical protein
MSTGGLILARGVFLTLAAAFALPGAARADPPARPDDRLTFRADRLEGDAAAGDLTLAGRVELAYDRYRLRSDRLLLHFDRGTIVFTGEARVALCPCPDPPIAFVAAGGSFAPPGDLVLRYPRVAVAGVPVFGLPWLWLRAPGEIGLLPPLLALRGSDGLLLGSGVRLPWRGPGGAMEVLDVSAGGYTTGGAEIGARLAMAGGSLGVTADLVHGTRVALDGRGAFVPEEARGLGVAFAIDAIRGDRARSGTVDLAPAAQAFDTGAAEVSLRADAGSVSAVVAGGALARAWRGEGPIAAGPRLTLALGGPIGGLGSWSADAGGVVLGGAESSSGAPATLPLGSASAGAELDARPGPFELRASARARGRFAGDGSSGAEGGPSSEAAAAARLDLELPFARTFVAVPGEVPLAHWIAPALSLRGAVAAQQGAFFVPIGGAVPGASWIAAAGLSTALGRQAGTAIRLDARAGATGDGGAAQALLHARLGVDARLAAAAVEAAAMGEPIGDAREPDPLLRAATLASPAGAPGAALLGRLRIGPATGLWLRLDAAAQEGGGAGAARAVAAGAWAALPGDDLAYLAAPGWTGGAELSIPWARAVRTAVRADLDLAARTLLAARALAEYRHPCGCFGLGLVGARRTGRSGVDVALTLDVAPPLPARPASSPGNRSP